MEALGGGGHRTVAGAQLQRYDHRGSEAGHFRACS